MLPRPSRRLAAALLWIAIALLPLRALAAAWMPTAMAAAATSASVVVNEMAAAMPCHGAGTPADDAAAEPGTTPACAFCAFCHGSVMAPVAALPALPLLPAGSLPAAADNALVQHESDGLFRPPRALLA